MYKNVFLLLFLMSGISARAQFDAFKYVVVPAQFEAFKQANMHKTSTLVKYHLDQRGYPAVYDLGRPDDLKKAPCTAVYTQFVDDSNLFATRVRLRFVDCDGKIVFETQEGYSKEKEYKEAYKEVIEEAFASFDGMSYTYSPPGETANAASMATEATQKEVAGAGQVPESQAAPDTPAAPATAVAEMQASDAQLSDTAELLYAQPIEGGYQLVDSRPEIRMLLMESSGGKDSYVAVVDGASAGTVYREGDAWIHEYYKEGKRVRTPLNIKF